MMTHEFNEEYKILFDSDFSLTVDYSQTLKHMINRGNYKRIDKYITSKNFPSPINFAGQIIEVSAKLFYFNFGGNLDRKDAIKKLHQEGYRPGILEELLSFGATYPRVQKTFSIAGIGCFSWSNHYAPYKVAYLSSSGSTAMEIEEYSRTLECAGTKYLGGQVLLGVHGQGVK